MSRTRVWQLHKEPGFPDPVGREGGRDFFDPSVVWRWLVSSGHKLAAKAPLLFQRPRPDEEAAWYRGAVTNRLGSVLVWDTAIGGVGLWYPSPASQWARNRGVRVLFEQLPHVDALVRVGVHYDLYGPELTAYDRRHQGWGEVKDCGVDWEDLAAVIGGPAPWWPVSLLRPRGAGPVGAGERDGGDGAAIRRRHRRVA